MMQRKIKKGPSTTAVAQTRVEYEIIDKALTLVIYADNNYKALNISASILNNTWIIYSGKIYHMTYDSR